MVGWKVVFTKQALKDAKNISKAGLGDHAQNLIRILEENPFKTPPPFKKLTGNLTGYYSRRISLQHRLVYQIFAKKKTVKVIRLWTHYGD